MNFRDAWAWILVVALAILGSMRSCIGFLHYSGEEVLPLVVPIAGVFVALALPAAQLAQSVKERLLESAEALIKAKPHDIEHVRKTLKGLVSQHRSNLESMKRAIYFSLASLLVGLLGLFGAFKPLNLFHRFAVIDFLASLSTLLLVVAVFRLLPVVASSFNLTDIDRVLRILDGSAPSVLGKSTAEVGERNE